MRLPHISLTICCTLMHCLLLGGCGPGEYEPTSEDRVTEAVSNVADAAGDPTSFQELFADGAAPPEDQRTAYGKYSFDAIDIAIVDGTATVKVDIISPFDDKSVGESTWTCTQVAGQWRLQSAPMPESLLP